MAQLFFKYGAMNSGKTIEILKVAHNYEEQDKPVVLMTSGLDTRDGVGKVSSRIGLRRDAIPIFEETNVFDLINDLSYKPFCVLVDECQFLNKHHELFEGSKYLLLYADKLEELKTICWFCHKKATMNLHYIDGKPVYEGDQVQIGGNEAYYPVCRKHYFHPKTVNEEQ